MGRPDAPPEVHAGLSDPARVAGHAVHPCQPKLAKLPAAHRAPTHIEQLRNKIAQEYDAFAAAVADWTRVKEQWLEEKKRAVIEHWEHASLQSRLREIELRLKAQRRRLRVLHAELA